MPGPKSPDQQITATPKETTSPRAESKPIGQRAKDVISKIKEKIGASTSSPNAALAEIATLPGEDIATAPDLELSDNSTADLLPVETPEKSTILDPEVEYQKALAQVQLDISEDPFAVFKKYAPKEEPSPVTSEKPRVFTLQDKARHKLLSLEARRRGIKDLAEFNRLVEYFESNFTQSTSRDSEYPESISWEENREERRKIQTQWKAKGYTTSFSSEPRNGKIKLHMYRDVPFNVNVDSIPTIKAIMATGVDPIPVINALKLNMPLLTRFPNFLMFPSSTDATKLIEFLRNPDLPAIIPFLEKMSFVPHETWKIYDIYSNESQTDKLSEFARRVDVSAYTPEFFEKVGVLAKAIGRKVDIEQLPAYFELVNNPDKLAFLAAAVEREIIPRPGSYYDIEFNVFDSLKVLEKDGLLNPLTTLLSAGAKIDKLRFRPEKPSNSPESQGSIDKELLRFTKEPPVQALLQNQDRQAFARILRKMTGENVAANLVEELYPIRQDLVTVNNLLFSTLDGEYERERYYGKKLDKLRVLLESEERRRVLVSPQFQEFVAGLEKDITINPNDYFYVQAQDMFDGSEHPKQEILLVQLFKAREIAILIDPDLAKKILRPGAYGVDQYLKMDRLKEILKYRDTIQLLKEAGVQLDPKNFQDDRWIIRVRRILFMRQDILKAVPQDKRAEWIRNAIKLPELLQDYMVGSGRTIEDVSSDQGLMVTPESMDRISKIAGIVSSSQFFTQEFRGDEGLKLHEIYATIGEYKGDLDVIFTNGNPNSEFAKLLIQSKRSRGLSLVLNPEMLNSFTGDTQNTLREWLGFPDTLQVRAGEDPMFPNFSPELADRYRVAGDIMRFTNVDSIRDKLLDFVTSTPDYKNLLANGVPARALVDFAIRHNEPFVAQKFITEESLSSYNTFERSVLATWMALPDDLKREVVKEAPEFPSVSPDLAERYRVAAEIIDRIRSSPSAEIKRIERELIGQLWKLDNPREALEEIIGVFEKNNLPLVGKVYRVFETIYDNPKATGVTALEHDLSTKEHLSPALRAASPKERREMIYKDLLSINVASGNPQLRDYLEVVRDGEGVVAKMEQAGATMLSERERQQLGHFFDKMDMLYTSSLFGRTIEGRRRARQIDSSPTTSHLSLEERTNALRRNFRVRAGQKLTDRLSEMFLKPLGVTTIEEALTAMDRSKAGADKRNRQFAESNEGKIVLKAGDRFKGVSSSNIGKILERGAVAGEYLGVSAGSDSTPYDSDTSLILEGDLTDGVAGAVKASLSMHYGDILLVIKDRGQFGTGIGQYESFASGMERHYGIRTGFASTEIDSIIIQSANSSNSGSFDDLYMAIAQNGVYIPVGDVNGNIIFTPEAFDEYRKTFDGVSEYSPNPVRVIRVDADQPVTRNALDQLVGEITADRAKVIELSNKIRQTLKDALAVHRVALRGEFDTSIYGAELIDTGSTARGSNVPGDYDFDMSLQLDPNDSKRLDEIAGIIKGALKLQQDASHSETDYIQVRGMGAQIIEGETLNIDIGVGKRSDEGIFASSDAVAQKLDSIRATLGDGPYHDVLANIVLAKKILKEAHAYKKLEDGGMGGIGVENWILLHDGNILDAFRSFWQAAHGESGNVVPYEEFANKYKVFDAGLNIKFNRHDNFVRILKPNGYIAMVNAIGQYLGMP